MTATDASRGFSDLLGRVASGEEVEITRAGQPVAVVSPAKGRLLSAERFAELLRSSPPVDDAFARDLREVRAAQGDVPGDPWAS